VKNRRVPHAVAWVRKGFAAIEEYERARDRECLSSDDPDEVAMAVLERAAAPLLPVSGDMWGISTLSFTLPPELRDRGAPIPPRHRAKPND
jgi:hypothetical protein